MNIQDMRLTNLAHGGGCGCKLAPSVLQQLLAYAARAQMGQSITDDAQLLEAAGRTVHLGPGSPTNVKITTRADLTLAQTLIGAQDPPKTPRASHPFADEEDRW